MTELECGRVMEWVFLEKNEKKVKWDLPDGVSFVYSPPPEVTSRGYRGSPHKKKQLQASSDTYRVAPDKKRFNEVL